MSLVKQKPVSREDTFGLTAALAAEFHQPTPGYVQPLISVTHSGSRAHILVVWTSGGT